MNLEYFLSQEEAQVAITVTYPKILFAPRVCMKRNSALYQVTLHSMMRKAATAECIFERDSEGHPEDGLLSAEFKLSYYCR